MRRVCSLIAAGTAVIVGLTAEIVMAQSSKGAGVVTAVSGPVTVNREEAPPQPLKFRDSLYWRDVVEARKDGIARLLLGGRTTVTVRELSRLELREEAQADGVRYAVELVTGKVRASVARVLMRPGEQVEVRTRNAVASVRGTDFIVETLERPRQAGAFGLLGEREVGEGIREGASPSGETVVVTLSGVVEVTNRQAGTGRAEWLGPHEAARISGRHDPVRLEFTPDTLRQTLGGLTPPRPREVKSGDAAASVSEKVAQVANAAPSVSTQSEVGVQRGGKGEGSKYKSAAPQGVVAMPSPPMTPPPPPINGAAPGKSGKGVVKK